MMCCTTKLNSQMSRYETFHHKPTNRIKISIACFFLDKMLSDMHEMLTNNLMFLEFLPGFVVLPSYLLPSCENKFHHYNFSQNT